MPKRKTIKTKKSTQPPLHNVTIKRKKRNCPPMSTNRVLYPPIKPYRALHLEVDTLKNNVPSKIYVEVLGNPRGIPVIYLHGGPGDFITPFLRRIFNPKRFNVVIFDQRGTGKSTPKRQLEKNTTQHSIADIEKIRKEVLKADKIIIAGGSWGASLATLYAQAHPDHTSAILLRGFVDLGRRQHQSQNYFNETYKELYPEIMEKFAHAINKTIKEHKLKLKYITPTNEGKYVAATLFKMVTSKNPHLRKKAANIWAMTADDIMYLNPEDHASGHGDNQDQTLTLATIDLHYVTNNYFLSPDQMITQKNVNKIKHIPTYFIHGRYDTICPIRMAYQLHRRLEHPKNRLEIVKAGHTYYEPEIAKGCIDGLNYLGDIVEKEHHHQQTPKPNNDKTARKHTQKRKHKNKK